MKPKIELSAEKKLIGLNQTISFQAYDVATLWQKFLSQRNKISHAINSDLISMSIYQPGFFLNFDSSRIFEKWAAVEVTQFEDLPGGLKTTIIPAGLYAIFHYKGLSTDQRIFEYIFKEWLPHSDYHLDDRPHFEVLGSKYKNNDPESEEDIWIPLTQKR